MTNEQTITDIINAIYNDIGFKGVIEFLENHLEYGGVERKEKGLYMVYTSGWSEDEILIDECLNYGCFVRKHFVGYLVGGAYYFVEDSSAEVEITFKHGV